MTSIYFLVSAAVRKTLFSSSVAPMGATSPVVTFVTKQVPAARAAKVATPRKEASCISAEMQRKAFKKGGFYRITVSGRVEFVLSARVQAAQAARLAAAAATEVGELLLGFFQPETKQARLARKEARSGEKLVTVGKNGILILA